MVVYNDVLNIQVWMDGCGDEHFISQNALPMWNFCKLQFSKFSFLSFQFKFQLNFLWGVADSIQIHTDEVKWSQFCWPPYSSPLSSCGVYSIEHGDSVNQEAVKQWTSAQPDL